MIVVIEERTDGVRNVGIDRVADATAPSGGLGACSPANDWVIIARRSDEFFFRECVIAIEGAERSGPDVRIWVENKGSSFINCTTMSCEGGKTPSDNGLWSQIVNHR